MEFIVSDEQKKKLIQSLTQNFNFIDFEEDFDDSTHNNNSFQNLKTHSIEKIKHDIENLTNNNVLSLYLARLFSIYCKRDVISVQLSNDQITEIFKNLSEDNLEYYKNKINPNNVISVDVLTNITKLNYDSKEKIYLDPDMQKAIQLFLETHYPIASDDENRKKVFDNLQDGFIEYHDYCSNRKDFETSDVTCLGDLYSMGLISKEDFLEKLGKADYNSSFINNVNAEYETAKQQFVNMSMSNLRSVLHTLPENISQENKEKLGQLLAKMDTIDPENALNEYNAIANDEWKKYIENGNGMLIHIPKGIIKGKFYDPTISTSLIDENHLTVFHNSPVGYKMKPKSISAASSDDIFINNSQKNKYYQSNSLFIDLPQTVSKEMKEKNTYSEVTLSDFSFESIVVLSINDYSLKLAKEMSESQQNIPIDVFDGKNFISIEEYSLNQIIANIRNDISSLHNYNTAINLLGLDRFDNDEQNTKASIINSLGKIDKLKSNMSRENILGTTKKLEGFSDIRGVVAELNFELRKKYEISLSEKVHNLIKSAQIQGINEQEASLKSEKITFLEKLFGKANLQNAKMQSLKLKKEEIRLEDINKNLSENESIRLLLNHCKQNSITPEIRDFLTNYANISTEKNIKSEINSVLMRSSNHTQFSPLPSINKKISLFKIKEQTNRILADNFTRKENINHKRNNSIFGEVIKVNNSNAKKSIKTLLSNLEAIVSDHTKVLDINKESLSIS